MLHNAKEIIEMAMKPLAPDKKYEEWSFLDHVRMGTAPQAQLDSVQCNLLVATLQEVVCDMHTEIIKDKSKRQQWAMQIATWINSVHAARCSST